MTHQQDKPAAVAWVNAILVILTIIALIADLVAIIEREARGAARAGHHAVPTSVLLPGPVGPRATSSGSYPLSGTPICGQALLVSPYNSSNAPALGTTTSVVTLPAGANTGSYNAPNTTYYFAPGVHTFGTGQFSGIDMGSNDWYVGQYSGGVGATANGQGLNDYGFSGTSGSTGMWIEYLTVTGFIGNYAIGNSNITGAIPYMTVDYDTVTANYPGSGVEVGTDGVVQYDCLTDNGDYGSQVFCSTPAATCQNSATTAGPQDATIANNEIAYNDQCNYENVPLAYFPISPPAPCYSASAGSVTLSSALSTASAITSLPVTALTSSIQAHADIFLSSGGNTQAFDATAGASSGATSITVASQTPNFAYPSGTPVLVSPGYFGCGCAGGSHFWNVDGTRLTNNYFHDNYDAAAWWDTDNNGELISGNYFANNFDNAVDLEISYNALIQDNNFVNNANGAGACGNASGNPCDNGGNMTPAIYLSESGGTSTVVGNSAWPTGLPISSITVSGNNFSNNWDALNVYEIPDRFSGSPDNTSSGFGTLGPTSTFTPYWDQSSSDIPTTTYYANQGTTGNGCGEAKLTGAVPGASPDYWDNCWWKVQNVNVTGNWFAFNASVMNGYGTTGSTTYCSPTATSPCGETGFWQQSGFLSWSPYLTFASGQGMWQEMANCPSGSFSGCTPLSNSFTNNTYTHTGSQNWEFWYQNGGSISIATWQGHGWDAGSTFS